MTWKLVAAVAGVLAAAVSCHAQHAQHARPGGGPRFELRRDTVLEDEVVPIRLAGLPPRDVVSVRLKGAGAASGWSARASFRTARKGRLDLARVAPDSGDYTGVAPMGLFWSARAEPGARPLRRSMLASPGAAPPAPVPWVLQAEAGGRVLATDTVWRRAVDPAVRITPVRDSGLVGMLYSPPKPGPHPAVIVLNGSQGGIPAPEGIAGGLASHGYVVLALGFFAAEGLPPHLVRIPLEYFTTAIGWLARQPGVDARRLGVVGSSRGAELALLLGATHPELRVVVAYMPSHVLWPGTVTDSSRAPAWTIAGQPLPWIRQIETPGAVARHSGCARVQGCPEPLTRHIFEALLDDSAATAPAEIPVERIRGPVLLISGRSDGLWPSTSMAEHVLARLYAHGFPYPAEHYAYADAGHAIGRPYVATPDVGVAHRHPVVPLMITPGGTPRGTALASEDSWRHVLRVLGAALEPGT